MILALDSKSWTPAITSLPVCPPSSCLSRDDGMADGTDDGNEEPLGVAVAFDGKEDGTDDGKEEPLGDLVDSDGEEEGTEEGKDEPLGAVSASAAAVPNVGSSDGNSDATAAAEGTSEGALEGIEEPLGAAVSPFATPTSKRRRVNTAFMVN
mmetsp:Transcript_23671/g.39145  ORF Transcript_23671/g.39145 Transcript_23671/m.39145 type:complete len:152 (-) Transcript_23671:173-628(-)